MSSLSLLAIPNIQGMHFWWYIQILGSVCLFALSLFFVLYYVLQTGKKARLVSQLHHIATQAQSLEQTLLVDKISKASGKPKLILFIAYLEKFVTTNLAWSSSAPHYANVAELLMSIWFTSQEALLCEQIISTHVSLPKDIERKIDDYISHSFTL